LRSLPSSSISSRLSCSSPSSRSRLHPPPVLFLLILRPPSSTLFPYTTLFRSILANQEASSLVDMNQVIDDAIVRVEQTGVVFIDELDKTVSNESENGPDVSGEGVQRDLLPIIEGSTVMTRFGPVKTDHILFIG